MQSLPYMQIYPAWRKPSVIPPAPQKRSSVTGGAACDPLLLLGGVAGSRIVLRLPGAVIFLPGIPNGGWAELRRSGAKLEHQNMLSRRLLPLQAVEREGCRQKGPVSME